MSKKRTKAARKKQRAKKRAASSSSSSASSGGAARQRPMSTKARDLDRKLEEGFVENEVVAEAKVPSGGGAFTAIRGGMTRPEEGPGANPLYKRRGLGEYGLWLAGIVGVVWLLVKVFGQSAQG